MLQDFQDALNVYLFPFVIAVPIAIVLYLLVTRRDEPAPTASPTPAPHPQPAATGQAAVLARSGLSAPSVYPRTAASTRPGATGLETGAEPAGSPSALLLVDDSAVARTKLRRLFEAAGYPVDVAKDGIEALEMLQRRHYALMITDLEMPEMDGLELIAAVHGAIETEDLPIIAITGHEALHAKVQDAKGLFGIFKKPWNDRELLRRVQALVRLQTPLAPQTQADAAA